MAKIEVELEFVDIENDNGKIIPGVRAICSECGNQTESFGTKSPSINRCLVLMREECPNNERNFYYTEESEG